MTGFALPQVFIIEELLIPLSDNFHQRSLYKRANKYTNIKQKINYSLYKECHSTDRFWKWIYSGHNIIYDMVNVSLLKRELYIQYFIHSLIQKGEPQFKHKKLFSLCIFCLINSLHLIRHLFGLKKCVHF